MSTNERAKVLTVEEAGRWLGIGRSAAYDAIQRNELPHIRIGRRIVVPIKALERLLDRDCRPASAEPTTSAEETGSESQRISPK